jgi:hypothetical protein
MGQAPVEYPKWDIRRDPFTEEDQSALVSDEEYTIPAASPFYVQLDEVPRLDDPSSVVVYLTDLLAEDLDISETVVTVTNGDYFETGDIIQIDDEQMEITGKSSNDLNVTRGYGGTTPATHDNGTRFFLTEAFTEVLTTPTARQYQVHYGTTAIPYKAGLVRFSEDHAEAVVWITYYKTGHYNWAEFVANSVNDTTLALQSFHLIGESAAEVYLTAQADWTLLKTITINTTPRDVLLWVEFSMRNSHLATQPTPGRIKVVLDDGTTDYSCGKWTGLAGDVLQPYRATSDDSWEAKDNIVPYKLTEYEAAFLEAGMCPIPLVGLSGGVHTVKFYGKKQYLTLYLKDVKVYTTRL